MTHLIKHIAYCKSKLKFAIKLIIISTIVIKSLLISIHKLYKLEKVFIAYRGFAHTIIDVSAFLEMSPSRSLVIILGEFNNLAPSFSQRNQVIPLYLGKEKIISINTRANIDGGLWIWAQVTKRMLKALFLLFRNRKTVIYSDARHVTKLAAIDFSAKSLQIPQEKAEQIFSNLEDVHKLANVGHIVGHEILFMKNWNVKEFEHIYKLIDKKIISAALKQINNNSYACLLIRNKKNSEVISYENYYIDAINLLYSKGFSTVLIGDTGPIRDKLKKESRDIQKKVLNFQLKNYKESQIFDFIAAANCNFALGDAGGAWSLLKIFNKPGLLINGLVSNLIFNVETLPKLWVYEKTGIELIDAVRIFNDLFFCEFISSDTNLTQSKIVQCNNSKDFILEVIKKYLEEKTYNKPRKMQHKVLEISHQSKYLELAKNCSYSNEYLKKLRF
jgi:hypothetical protein